jgi:hypothetical protein
MQAAVNLFERFAGRTAMIGFGVALLAELLLPAGSEAGLFGAWAAQGSAAGQFAAFGMLLLCCSGEDFEAGVT